MGRTLHPKYSHEYVAMVCLVSYVMRYVRPTGKEFTVLELGCGAGANIPFFLSLGVQYYAIEGSSSVIKKLHDKFPQIKKNLVSGDFTQDMPFNTNFDLVVDRSSVTHNTEDGIRNCLKIVHNKLQSEGKYVGIDWFSLLHSDYVKGQKDSDVFTKTGYAHGQFASVGRVHFSNKEHLVDLFKDFDILVLEHKEIKTEIPVNEKIFASWNLVAQKKTV